MLTSGWSGRAVSNLLKIRFRARRSTAALCGFLLSTVKPKVVVVESRLSKFEITNGAKVVSIFLIGGLLSGLFFAWLSRPNLRSFWYLKGDKFLLPTYKYWLAFGLIFTLGLIGSYGMARLCMSLSFSIAFARGAMALIVIAISPLLLFLTTHANFIIALVFYIVFLPFALCVLNHLRRLPLAILQNSLVLVVALFLTYGFVNLINPTGMNMCKMG